MTPSITKFSVTLPACVAAVALLMLDCAEERDPVNRVQPYAIDKAYFIGEDFTDTRDDPEFYTRNHVIDVGYGAEGASEGLLFTSTPLEPVARIKWQITEDYLIGRLSYERIAGSDGKGVPDVDKYGRAVGRDTNDGAVVVMFEIESHFDIVNAYNPTTGEKLNVIEENAEDRPWNQRQYFRVDWSKNLSTDNYDFDTLSLMGVYDGVEYQPVSYFVDDPEDEDAPVLDFDNGYFDITTKAFATPRDVDLSHLGWGLTTLPACFLPNEYFGGSYPAGSCGPVEITLRHSFLRVDRNGDGVDDSDYEPRDYDGVRFEHYGGFYHERYGYSRNYGLTDEQWHRLLNRYDLWKRSHYYGNPEIMSDLMPCNTEATTPAGLDPNRDFDGNGTADECEGVTMAVGFAGSQCDPFKHRCTLPFRAREPKPIPFYYTDTGNPDYFEPSELAVHEWDVALRSSVQAARYAECIRTLETTVQLPSDWNAWARDELKQEGLEGASLAEQKAHLDAAMAELKGDYAAERDLLGQGCKAAYPMWTGQMVDQQDAVFLAGEVDDCRNRRTRGYLDGDREQCELLSESLTYVDPSPPSEDDPSAPRPRLFSEGVKAIARMDEMIVLCHSPVAYGDPALCGDRRMPEGATAKICDASANTDRDGDSLPAELQRVIDQNEDIENLEDLTAACDSALRVRHGDLRYHVINVIDAPQEPSPWGIYASSVDPLTGEVIATNCNVWSHATDLYSQRLVDQMRLIKGELTFEDLTEATHVTEWAEAADAASRDGALGTLSRGQLASRLSEYAIQQSDVSFLDEAAAGMVGGRAVTPEERLLATELRGLAADIRADARASSASAATYEARREAARGTELEAALMTKAILQRNGLDEGALTSSAMDTASPLRGGSPTVQRDISLMMENNLHTRNMCILKSDHEAISPTSLARLADEMEKKFTPFNADDPPMVQLERAEIMRRYIASRLHYGVLSHEVGHSMAHRHNFVGSADAWSYHPQYWQLRTLDGTVTAECNGTEPNGDGCVGPRYIDPVSDAERGNLIHMFMSSSIMDYPGEVTQNFMGPGIWDFAAARMFYGDVVTVIDEEGFYTLTDENDEEDELERDIYTYSKKSDTVSERVRQRFGGIIGITYTHGVDEDGYAADLHYSQLNRAIGMISDCHTVVDTGSPNASAQLSQFISARYDETESGKWHPVLDGRLVAPAGGNLTRCRQPRVDYVNWSTLKKPQLPGDYSSEWRIYDDLDRVIAPYSFGTDNWADLGNAAVYRHDNGADLFEIFNFLITEKELGYLFDKYRLGRADFSLRKASDRALYRYNAKIRDGAKGLAFIRNFYEQHIAPGAALNPDALWAYLVSDARAIGIEPNLVAAIYAFDHFAKELARPESGPHGYTEFSRDNVLRSDRDSGPYSIPEGDINVIIPNGPSGEYWGTMGFGGELLENQFDEEKGEFSVEYYLNCGSYYDKLNVPMLLTESVDNFVSSSRTDFHDPRFRSNSLADLFPNGFRRLIGNALTNDEIIKGPRIPSDAAGNPIVTGPNDLRLAGAVGWTHWDGESPSHCFPTEGRTVCTDLLGNPPGATDGIPEYAVPIDSQIGWEQQKFLIAMTLLYLPENQKQQWLEQLRIWEIGRDTDPGFADRIEFRDPEGRTFVARTFGTEEIFGKTVQKGIAARVLEYANELLQQAYETDPVPGEDGATVIAYDIRTNSLGDPLVRWDHFTSMLCREEDSDLCTCEDNRYCLELRDYVSVPQLLREAVAAYGMDAPDREGILD